MRTSSIPNWRHSVNQICRIGVPRIGRRHFGVVSVNGRRRVPCPPASRKAFMNVAQLIRTFAGGLSRTLRRRPFASLLCCDRRKSPAHSTVLIAVDEGVIGDNLSALKVKFKSHLPGAHARQGIAHTLLVLLGAKQ